MEESSFWENGGQTPNNEADETRLIKEAAQIATQSDVVVLALGETESSVVKLGAKNTLATV